MGSILGKIGGDIASVAGKSFSGMVSAVLTGVKDSFLENPMNILAPIGYMVLPLGATLGMAQLVPTVIQKAFQGGSVSRGIGKMGSALWGASNTQAGDLLLKESRDRVQKAAKRGALLDPEDLKNTDRVAGTKFTRVKPSNINSLMQTYIDDLEKSTNSFRNSTIGHIATKEQNIIDSRKGQGRSSRATIEDTISKAYNVNELSPDEAKGLEKSRTYLKSAGYSDKDIASIERTRALETITSIEDYNYSNGKGRKLQPNDHLSLRDSLISPTYNYKMDKRAVEAIRDTQVASKVSETPFDVGNRITDRQLGALKNKSSLYSKLNDVETPDDFMNKYTSNSFSKRSLNEFSKTGQFDLDQFKSQATAYNDLKGVQSVEGFNKQVRTGKFTEEQLNNFSKQTGLSVNDLKGLQPSELGGFYQKTPGMTDDILKGLKTNPMSGEILNVLKSSEKLHRGIYSHTKSIYDDIKSGKVDASMPMAQAAVESNPYIAQVKSLTKNIDNLKELNGYDMSNMLSPKTSNRMSRILNMSGDSLGDVNIPITDPTKIKALGTENINLMSAINTPEFKAYQKGGVEALSSMDVSGTRKALQGQEALQSIVNNPELASSISESMTKGGSRLKGYSALTRLGSSISKTTVGRGLKYAAGATMAVIDPITMGYGAGELAYASGMSGKASTAIGVGAAGLTGAGLYGKYSSLIGKETANLAAAAKEAGTFTTTKALAPLAKTNASALMGKSLTSVAGLGGGLAVAQTALSVATAKFQADKDIAEFNKKSESTINSYRDISKNDKETLIKNTSNMTTSDNAKSSGGISALLASPWATLGNLAMIAGGGALALSAPATGGLTGFAGLTAASVGISNLASTYYGGSSKPSDQAIGMQGLINGIINGTAYQDKKIADYDKDINELEFSKSISKLSPEENAKLVQTKALRAKTVDNKNIQLGQISTVGQVYSYDDKGEFDAETGTTIQTAPLANTTSYKLSEYLKSGKQATGKGAISEYLGLAQVDVQAKAELNKKYDEAVKNKDTGTQSQILVRDADINNQMGARFIEAAANVDYKNADQVEIVRASETNRLKSMVVPYNDPEQMKKFKSLNQGSLLSTSISSSLMGSIATDQSKRNLYSSVEVAANEKLAAIGINNPFATFKQTQQEYLDQNMPKSKNAEGFNALGSDTRDKLSKAGITNIDELTAKSDEELAPVYNKLSYRQQESVAKVREDGNFNKNASIKEYQTMQADVFKSLAGFGGVGKPGSEEFEKLATQQESYKNADLSGFSKAEQTNITSNINRRGSAIQTLQTFGPELEKLAKSTTGKEVKDLTPEDVQKIKESPEFKTDEFDNVRASLDLFSNTTVGLNKTFGVTKDIVEKGLNNSLEKSGILAANYHSGALSKESYMQQAPSIYGEMKSSVEGLRATGNKNQSDASIDFNKLVGGNASLQNVAQSLGVTSAADLVKRDESGITGLSKIQASGFSDFASMEKLASIGEQYTTGQKAVNDANMMGMSAATKAGVQSFQSGGAASKEAEIAGGRIGFDYKNRKKLKEIAGQEMKFYTDAYLNATSEEDSQKALAGLQLADQNASKLGMSPGQLYKAVGGKDVYRSATSKMTEKAATMSLAPPQVIALAGNNYKPIDKDVDQSKYTKGELADAQMGGELPVKNKGALINLETKQRYEWDDSAKGGKGAAVQVSDMKEGEAYTPQWQKYGTKQNDGINRVGSYTDKDGNIVKSEFNNVTGEFSNVKNGPTDISKFQPMESTILPKLDNNAVDNLLQPLQMEAIVTPKMDGNALQNTQISLGSEPMLGGETNNVAELNKGLDGVVGSLTDFNGGFNPQSESGSAPTPNTDWLTGSIGSDLTVPNPKQWADTIASAVAAPLSTVSTNMTDRNNAFTATAISSEATDKVMKSGDVFDNYTKSMDTGDGALNSQQIATQGAITDGLLNGTTLGLEVPKNDPSIRFDFIQ